MQPPPGVALPWWQQPRHDRPELDAAQELRATEHATWLRGALRAASSPVAAAMRHTAWAIAYWAKRKRDRPWVTYRYVETGAGVSARAARRGLREVMRLLGASRDATGVAHIRAEAIAAAWDVAAESIRDGDLAEPAVSVPVSGPLLPLPTFSRDDRGVCRCTCGGHHNGDATPSALYDRTRHRLTCLATAAVFLISAAGMRRIDRGKPVGTPGAISNRCPSGPRRPALPAPVPPTAPGVRRSLLHRRPGASWLEPLPAAPGTWEDCFRRADAAADRDDAWARSAAMGYPDGLAHLDAGTSTTRVLFDLDGLAWAHQDWREVAPALDGALRGPRFSGAATVVATSCHGVQVVAELREPVEPRGFYRDPGVRQELEAMGAALLAVLDRGGRCDPSGWAPGRLCRLPGPRVRDGLHEVARLAATPIEDRRVVRMAAREPYVPMRRVDYETNAGRAPAGRELPLGAVAGGRN